MDLGLILTFLVIFHLLPLFLTQEFNQPLDTCPKDFQCGNLGIMKFPFANLLQPYCGLCVVDCHNHPFPIIKLHVLSVQPFLVKNMSQSNFLLHDYALENTLKDHSCYTFMYNVSLPDSPSISFKMMSNITLFRCEKNPRHMQEVVDYFHDYRRYESCEDFDVYYKNAKSQSSLRDLEPPPTDCKRVLLPIHSWDNVTDNTELFQLLTADFDLEWHLSDECYHDCYLKGGFCQTVDNKFRCAYADTGIGNLVQSGHLERSSLLFLKSFISWEWGMLKSYLFILRLDSLSIHRLESVLSLCIKVPKLTALF